MSCINFLSFICLHQFDAKNKFEFHDTQKYEINPLSFSKYSKIFPVQNAN